jgi:signal transduction histidine kinase
MTRPVAAPDTELLEVFTRYHQAYFQDRDVRPVLDLFDPMLSVIGTSPDEFTSDFDEIRLLYARDLSEAPMPIRIDERRVDIRRLTSDCGIIVYRYGLYIDTHDVQVALPDFRGTYVFVRRASGWKLVHSHVSTPMAGLDEPAAWPIKALQQRNSELEALVAARTAELAQAVQEKAILIDEQEAKILERTCELALARDEAESAGRAKSAFLTRMSHEMRTPLHQIKGMAYLMAGDLATQRGQKHLATLERASSELLEVMSSVLDFSRTEADRITLHNVDFDMRDMIDGAVGEVVQAVDSQVEVRVELEPGLPLALRGDPVRLGQVLTILLDNAVRFSNQGHVLLRVSHGSPRPSGVRLRVEVADFGPGIPSEQLQTVFEPFRQGDESLARRHGGIGLGLALAQRLVRLMAGEIRVDSTPGEGSTFAFDVQLQPARAALLNATDNRQRALETLHYLRALLADDDAKAHTLWHETRASLKKLPGVDWRAFELAVKTYDFDTAVSLLGDLA